MVMGRNAKIARNKKTINSVNGVFSGFVDFGGVNCAFLTNADLSKVTGFKGVKKLIIEKSFGLKDVLNISDVENVAFIETDTSNIHKFICSLKTKVEGLPKGEWSGYLQYLSSSEVRMQNIDKLLEETR